MAAGLAVHLLPVDVARGAQAYARELRNALDRADQRHRTLALFASTGPGGALDADTTLGVAPGLVRRAGLDPRAVWRLRRFIARERPDVVVCHGSEPLKYAVAAGVERHRLVAYKIGARHARLTPARRAFHGALLRRCAMVAAVSDDAADEARAMGIAPERLRVIPNGRDPAVYRPGPRDHDRARPRLVFVGHLDVAKRPGRFIELVARLRERGLVVDAAIAGDGPLRADLAAPAAAAGVDLLGVVDDVPALLARSDVLVMTSGPNEGMPGVLIEAGLAGLPVVSTAVPGAIAVIDDGATGFTVGIDDVDALVERTAELVRDATRRERLGAAARARCVEHFSLDASAAAWRALLDGMTAVPCTSST